MRHIARRCMLATLTAVVTATSVALGAAPASAGVTTVHSPVKIFAAPSVDILSATVNYDRVRGSLSATIVLRGAPVRLRNGGPGYSVGLYGPKRYIGSGASIAMSSVGVPARPVLQVARDNRGVTAYVPVRVRYVGNRVVFTARDPRLANLPVRFVDVQASASRQPDPARFFGIDGIYGRPLR